MCSLNCARSSQPVEQSPKQKHVKCCHFSVKPFLILQKMLHRLLHNIGSKWGRERVEARERVSRNAGKNRHEKVGQSQSQMCFVDVALQT